MKKNKQKQRKKIVDFDIIGEVSKRIFAIRFQLDNCLQKKKRKSEEEYDKKAKRQNKYESIQANGIVEPNSNSLSLAVFGLRVIFRQNYHSNKEQMKVKKKQTKKP